MNLDITDLLTFCVQEGGSDLHISAGEPPMIRRYGDIVKVEIPPLEPTEARTLLYDIMNDKQRQLFEEHLELDFSFSVPNVARFRANIYMQQRGLAGAFRVIPEKIRSMEELGAPEVFKKLARMPRGLVLVTGPTGSGKSTTLASIIEYINQNMAHHILTIEDPVEFIYEPKRSLINQREVGSDTHAFSNALRAALREDPDVILIGEMRDLETISLALTAAETGHLVFGTLHTNSAPKTVDRIVDSFPGNEKAMVRAMLSESLQGVISQTLLKRADGKGRVAAYEVMLGTPAVRNLIREDKVPQLSSVIQTSTNIGMQTLGQHLKKLVAEGIVTEEEALSKVGDKAMFS
ncbi:type IV pilus twitching motility protein PilT [Sulfurivirga sp.]|uniref:type IV pilus twitching motility protein PilT n=1 Tax=Sulfurivirga sp. TaxID=2614236 RepID=UPI0025D261AC|nr:type IV pilus twitching motility protein PilT [Sulfurivirga sp.]